MFERPHSETTPKEEPPKEKVYKSSIEEVTDYLEGRTNEMRQRRAEGKEPTLEEVAVNMGDIYKGFQFAKERGTTLKNIGKETIKGVLRNPFGWEDLLTQGAAKAQQVVATHMSERIEKKLEIKAETLKTISDVEAEEQRLAALRANLEAAEQILKAKKAEVFTAGRKIGTPDPTDSLKNGVELAFAKRRADSQQAVGSFINQLFGSL